MQRGAAPKSDHGAFGDVQSLLNGMDPCRARHVLIDDFDHRLCTARRVGLQRLSYRGLKRLLCGGRIERDAPARETIRIQPAQHEVGISHCRSLTTAVITGRPRFGAGTLRAYRDTTQVIHTRQRASARADFNHVDDRDLDRHAAAFHEAVRTINLKGP